MADETTDVERLVSELSGSGMLDAEAITDLNVNYLEPWKRGELDSDDRAYVEAFHARIMSASSGEAVNEGDVLTPEDWQDRLTEMQSRAERAEARVATLEAELAALKSSPA